MKKSLIFISIFVVAFIAFFDAKDRFAELDKVAGNTPSQVEMNQMMNRQDEQMKKHIPDFQSKSRKEAQTIQDKMNEGRTDSQNQLNNINKRRDSINNKQ